MFVSKPGEPPVSSLATLVSERADRPPVRWRRGSGHDFPRHGCGLQPGAVAQTADDAGMSVPANCTLVGRWRIVEADIWDRDHLDLCGPATITITDHVRGEIAFGALQAGLDIEYSSSSVGFTWEGFDEMDEVSGDGSAELLDDGSIEIEFAYHNGDEAVLKAQRRDFFNSLLVRTN
jgi:hypothetical protein